MLLLLVYLDVLLIMYHGSRDDQIWLLPVNDPCAPYNIYYK